MIEYSPVNLLRGLDFAKNEPNLIYTGVAQ